VSAARVVYQASPIKHRSTRAEIIRRRTALWNIVSVGRPVTVRQVIAPYPEDEDARWGRR
jgi:hypothetical protein